MGAPPEPPPALVPAWLKAPPVSVPAAPPNEEAPPWPGDDPPKELPAFGLTPPAVPSGPVPPVVPTLPLPPAPVAGGALPLAELQATLQSAAKRATEEAVSARVLCDMFGASRVPQEREPRLWQRALAR